MSFQIHNLVAVLSQDGEKKTVLNNISLEINSGLSFLVGKNGAGKSSLAQTIIGNPNYTVESGSILFENEDIVSASPEDRAKKGIFVSFQNPPELEGVSTINLLHTIYIEKFGIEDELSRSTFKFRKAVIKLLDVVGLSTDFVDRAYNLGFSGGEKKRMEILQMLLFKPKLIILDEIDSGLDIHAQKILFTAIDELKNAGSAILFITHNISLVEKYSDVPVHIINQGEITQSGGVEILQNFKDQ